MWPRDCGRVTPRTLRRWPAFRSCPERRAGRRAGRDLRSRPHRAPRRGALACATPSVSTGCCSWWPAIRGRSGRAWSRRPTDRLAMARAAIDGLDGLEVSAVEVERPGPTYTIDTLRALTAADRELFLIVGADVAARVDTWHRADEVRAAATLVVVARDLDPTALDPATTGGRGARRRAHPPARRRVERPARPRRAGRADRRAGARRGGARYPREASLHSLLMPTRAKVLEPARAITRAQLTRASRRASGGPPGAPRPSPIRGRRRGRGRRGARRRLPGNVARSRRPGARSHPVDDGAAAADACPYRAHRPYRHHPPPRPARRRRGRRRWPDRLRRLRPDDDPRRGAVVRHAGVARRAEARAVDAACDDGRQRPRTPLRPGARARTTRLTDCSLAPADRMRVDFVRSVQVDDDAGTLAFTPGRATITAADATRLLIGPSAAGPLEHLVTVQAVLQGWFAALRTASVARATERVTSAAKSLVALAHAEVGFDTMPVDVLSSGSRRPLRAAGAPGRPADPGRLPRRADHHGEAPPGRGAQRHRRGRPHPGGGPADRPAGGEITLTGNVPGFGVRHTSVVYYRSADLPAGPAARGRARCW